MGDGDMGEQVLLVCAQEIDAIFWVGRLSSQGVIGQVVG